MSERAGLIHQFLEKQGWAAANIVAVPGDASARRYFRLTRNGKKAILMDAPIASDFPAEPEGATEDERKALGYGAMARLAGSEPAAFLCVAHELTIRGFSAPQIYAADENSGLILLEDLGSNDFASVVKTDPSKEEELYEAAVECLAAIYRSSFPLKMTYQNMTWRVRDYDKIALMTEMSLMQDWYAPDTGVTLSDKAMEDWNTLWDEPLALLSRHAPGLALRDFHAENIFWIPNREGTANVGLIDFQDALWTHPAYDLASLIEDIRRDVDQNLVEPLKQRFCEKAGLAYDDDFRAAYAVMGAQRSTKLLGFPVRADKKFGKPQYRVLLPRVKRHLNLSLSHPALSEVRDWYERYVPEVLS